jgi:hypothetical protein
MSRLQRSLIAGSKNLGFHERRFYDDDMNNDIEVLRAYSRGDIPPGEAMSRLGLDWYGDLLVLLNQHEVERPRVSEADADAMRQSAAHVLDDLK